MIERPTTLIALSNRKDLESLRALLGDSVTIVAEATTVKDVQKALLKVRPQVAVMALHLPDGESMGLLAEMGNRSATRFILVAEAPSAEDYRRAMRAGASDLLALPVTAGEILDAIRKMAAGESTGDEGRIITVFSTKGGVGKTTVAANVAADLAARTRLRVCLVDLDLEFGNLSAFYGAVPKLSIADLCRTAAPLTLSNVQEAMVVDPVLGIPILSSPPTPDLASVVDGEAKKDPGRNYVVEILSLLRFGYDYVVVDTAARFSEATITALDEAWRVLMVASPDIPALQSTARGLSVLVEKLGYSGEKLKLILNRSNAAIGLTHEDMTEFLNFPITYRLPSDGDAAVRACNTGLPMVRKRGRSPLARSLRALVKDVIAPSGQVSEKPARPHSRFRPQDRKRAVGGGR